MPVTNQVTNQEINQSSMLAAPQEGVGFEDIALGLAREIQKYSSGACLATFPAVLKVLNEEPPRDVSCLRCLEIIGGLIVVFGGTYLAVELLRRREERL